MPDDDQLRLIALDAEDLAVLSAHLQDAVFKVKDIIWFANDRRVVIAMNRFAWEAKAGGRSRDNIRRRSALQFARVEKVQSVGIDRSRPETVLELLAIRFEPTNRPSGDVVLEFAGGGALRFPVEVLEAQLTDLGPAWTTAHAPRHLFS